MANGTRSTRRDKDDEEDNNSKGSLNSGKKFVNSGATTAEASGVRRSPRETPSRKNMTPASSSNTRKSERLEKQSSNSNSLTPPAKRKFERIEKQTDPSPLRRSERSKMASSSGSSGSKKSDKSPDSLEMKRKKEKKEKSVKQLTMETLEVEKIDKEDKQTREGTDRRRDARSYRALLGKDLKNPTTGDHSDNRNRTDVEKRDKGLLGEQTERTLERTVMTSASQSVKEALESNTEHKLPSTSQNDSGKYIFSNGDSRQVSKSGLAKEVNGDAEKAVLENLQKEKAVCDSAKQGACSSNTKLNQFFEPSDSKDRRKLNSSSNTGDVEKPCNDMQTHISSTDLQRGDGQNICIVCKVGAKLLCCEGKGCQRSYHLSCLEPPLKEFPLGVWLCPICVRKKIESGVHSVSEGIEAIWDSREVEASQGLQRQKQYFVQYKGLAHVHNRWVPENQVLLEAPSLVAKYNRRNQGAVWKQQWAVPHRVLQKRLLTTSKESDEQHHHKGHDGHKLDCHVEWLVKWRGLGYEHASWELENAPFLSCQEGQSLIQDYETRRKKAKTASKFDKEHAQERTEVAFPCSQLPAGVSSRLNANLDAVNKLCNYWRKGQNAIIFDDQERIPNVISFILSFLSYNSRPFLIISTSASQYSWEEFFHLAPSADVVVYSGSKEIRESIRSLEFYEERGGIMFQVLITSPEVISEDLNVLDCIGWEAIIVDECQRPRITSCFEQIKLLTARRRLLIVSGQLKDNMAEYLNLLSLLDSQSNSNDSDGLLINSSDVIGILKERLAKYIAYGESPRFVEYWVPVQLSNVQLEKYCFTLLSNSLSLCSPSRTDPVGAVRNILITCRKCCDHPYVVDESLQALLTKDLQMSEFLDVGIKASGKLQLLDAMLSDIKKRELKVLILVQSIGGSGRELMGDILDDFVRQRFGADSYERVESGLTSSKKQSAMNKFNNERQRFVFLLETRACLPSIKLSAIGIVIIFGSDWSPMNDLKALNKITLDSQFEQIKVFRLYSSFTVEEKVLMFSKQDKTLDSNIQSVSPSTSHMLLKWGASYLFSQLDKFHGMPTLDEGSFSEQSYLKDVIKEFFIILDQTEIDNDASMLSLILQAKQNRGNYRTEMPLFGEQRLQVMNEDPPHIFWMKLLEGKSPQWKYSSCSSQRIRKRVQHFDPEAETAEGVKKRKKVASDCNDLSPKAGLHEDKMVAGDREGSSESLACGLSHSFSRPAASGSDKVHSTSNSLHLVNNMSQLPALDMAELEDRRKQRDLQKNLHGLLKPQMAKLCEVLHLSEDVKAIVEKFLEYVMNNHRVSREPAAILQAFQISLCWSAASMRKHKIDHKESLMLAKQNLGFTCTKEEADYVHSMLKCLRTLFLYRTGYLKVPESPKAAGRDYSNATFYQQNVKAKNEDMPGFQDSPDIKACAEPGVARESQWAQMDLVKSIKGIEKKFDKKMTKLLDKQKEERVQFNRKYEEDKAKLENKKRTEAAVIRIHSNVSMRADKLKKLDTEYAGKFDDLEQQRDVHLKNLEELQEAARTNILDQKNRWIEAVKAWAPFELLKPSEMEVNPSGRTSARVIQSASGSEESLSKIIHIDPDEVMACSDPIDRVTGLPRLYKENTEGASVEECNATVSSAGAEQQGVCNALSEQAIIGEVPDKGRPIDAPVTVSSGDVIESVPSLRSSDEDRICNGSKLNVTNGNPETVPPDSPDNFISAEAPSCGETPGGATLSKPDNGEAESVTVISTDDQVNLVLKEAPSSVEVFDLSNLNKVDGQVSLRNPMLANSGEGQESLHSAEAPSSAELPDGDTLSMVDGVLLASAPGTVSSSECPEKIMSDNCSPEKQISAGATSNFPDEVVPESTPEIATSSCGMDISICRDSSSSKEQMPDTAALSIPTEEVTLAGSETAPDQVLEGSVHRENDAGSSIGIDPQDGVACALNQESEFLEPALADVSTVQHVPTIDRGGSLPQDQLSPNVGSLPSAPSALQGRDAVNVETQNASQVAESSTSTAAIDVRRDESNLDRPVVELGGQMQPLRSGESTANLSPPNLPSVSAIGHLPNNEGQTSQAPRQPVGNHIELSNQDVLLPPLHTPTHGPIGGLVRHVSETRTASVPSVSGAPPVQSAVPALSRVPHPLYSDPLQIEMERIRTETDQTIKNHEDMKQQIKLECEKEIEMVVAQIRRKHEVKLQEKEAEFMHQKKELDVNYNKVLLNKILAEAFRSKCMDNKASGSATLQQEASSTFMQQLAQLSSQQPSAASGLPSVGSVSSVQTVSPAVVNAPLQVVHPPNPPRPRPPPHISSISPSTGNLQMGSEFRAPAPHLQPFRPSGLVQSYSNPFALRQPSASSCQSARVQPETAGGLASVPSSSLPSSDVSMGMNNLSGTNANPPTYMTTSARRESSLPSVPSNPAQQSAPPDIVCLSDDD